MVAWLVILVEGGGRRLMEVVWWEGGRECLMGVWVGKVLWVLLLNRTRRLPFEHTITNCDKMF